MKIKLQNFLKFIPGTHKKEKIVELHPAHEIPLTATSLHSMSLFHADKQNQTDRMNHVNHAGATAPPFFERRVDEVDLKKSMELFHFLSHIFHKNSVAWCLMFGSLAGQHFFHGIIPWDDDWDVLAVAEPDRIEALLIAGVKDTPSLEFYRHKEAGFFKVFHKSSINAGQHPWKWPFVDIFYSKTDDEFLDINPFKFRLEKIFPLKYGFFHGLLLPIPRKPLHVIEKLYKRTFNRVCESGYDHRNELYYGTKYIPCAKLREKYAWVNHSFRLAKSGVVRVESFERNGDEFHRIEVFDDGRGRKRYFLVKNG